jgi:predicted secreted protein
MRRSKVLICLVLPVLLAAACSDDYSGDGDRDVDGDPVETTEPADDDAGGEEAILDLEQTDVQVAVGDTVVVELEENASVGDDWELETEPDGAVLELVAESFDSDDPEADGAGGTVRFEFEAVGDGGTELTFANCYRCTSDGEPSEEPPEPAEVTFSVEVTA